MTGLDHQDNPKIEEAGHWLASIPRSERPSPIIPVLRQRFGLTAPEACAAIRESVLAEGRAH